MLNTQLFPWFNFNRTGYKKTLLNDHGADLLNVNRLLTLQADFFLQSLIQLHFTMQIHGYMIYKYG